MFKNIDAVFDAPSANDGNLISPDLPKSSNIGQSHRLDDSPTKPAKTSLGFDHHPFPFGIHNKGITHRIDHGDKRNANQLQNVRNLLMVNGIEIWRKF